MNIADIRKKAHRDRVDSVTEAESTLPVVAEPDDFKVDSQEERIVEPAGNGFDPEPDFLLEEDIPEENDQDDTLLEYTLLEEPEIIEPPAPQIISTPALPASAAIEYAAATSVKSQIELDEERELPTTGSQGLTAGNEHVFDPLEVLLAGRASSGYGENLDFATADDADNEVSDYQEFLCFRVCREQYAINIMEIKEIIKPREITEVPRLPDFIIGVLSLRGIIIPVFSMMKRLHLEPVDKGSRERIIVVSRGEELYGIHVDEVLQVVRIPEGSIELPPAVLEGIDRDFILGIGHYSNGMLILLNMGNILDVSLY